MKQFPIGNDIEIHIERNEIGQLFLKDEIDLMGIDICTAYYVLFGEGKPIPVVQRPVLLSGFELESQTHVEIRLDGLLISLGNIGYIKFSTKKSDEITRCDVHYLYNNKRYSEQLKNGNIHVDLLDTYIEIHGELFQNTPENLNSLSISYPTKRLSEIPNDARNKRDALLVGFLFGGALTNVGYTAYTSNDDIAEIYYCNPRIAEILQAKYRCISPFGERLNINSLEVVFNQVLSEKMLSLTESDIELIMALLHRLWGSNLLYLDLQLILINSGLEVFMKGWCKKLGKIKGQEKLLEKAEYNNLFSNETAALKKKIHDCDVLSAEVKQALETNLGELRINRKKEKLETMYLLATGWKLTDEEIHIIELRGKMNHETPFIPDTDEDIAEYRKTTTTAINLCYQTLLAFLEYKGDIHPYIYKD